MFLTNPLKIGFVQMNVRTHHSNTRLGKIKFIHCLNYLSIESLFMSWQSNKRKARKDMLNLTHSYPPYIFRYELLFLLPLLTCDLIALHFTHPNHINRPFYSTCSLQSHQIEHFSTLRLSCVIIKILYETQLVLMKFRQKTVAF